jgi:mono/diheme cytochrome c family protein
MNADSRSSGRAWLWFAVSSVIFLLVLAISPLKDYFREYRGYQTQYRQMLLDRAGSRSEIQAAEALTVGIHQIWNPERDDRVDRCVTCHLGIEDATMRDAPQPFRAHPTTPHTPADLQEFGCVACHRGQGRATSSEAAHGDVSDWGSPLLPLPYTEASCGRCHLGDVVPEASLLSAGRELLDRAGCYGCHEVEGHEDWESDAPDLDGLSRKTHPGWLRAWLSGPREVVPDARMPNFLLSEGEIESLVAFLWAQPSLPSQELGPDEDPPPGDYDRGRKVFRESRCISCHTVEGRGNGNAPELSRIGSKVNRRWLIAFLKDPHAFQPDTAMPRHNFTREDLLDVSQYMMEEFIDMEAPDPGPPVRLAQRLIEEGEKLYRKFGCGGCHQISGGDDRVRIGPELTGIGEKPVEQLDFGERGDLPRTLPDWLAAKITEPRSFYSELKMPVPALAPEEVQALVTALLSLPREPVLERFRVRVPEGSYRPPGRFGRLVDRYRCLSCHRIHGTGGDLSTAPLTAEGSRVKHDWLRDYLLVPATIRPLLTDRMVHLRMPEDEAAFMADFMENVYVDEEIPGELFPEGPPSELVARGRSLFYERYGCQSCHMVNNRGGYYGPLLDGLGDRLESGWIFWWLQGPQRWQGDIRCPDFGLDDEDAKDLTAYIVSISSPKEKSGT